MTTEHKEIEPVAFVMAGVLLNMHQDARLNRTQWQALLRCTQVDESEVPLYPQSAIDALQAEKAALFAKMDKLEGRAVLAEAQRDELLALSRDVVMNGHEIDVGGGDVAITTCDAFEALSKCLEDNYPEPLGELTERERVAIANAKGAEE